MTTTIDVPVGKSVLNITQEGDKILFEFVPKFKEGDFLYFEAYGQETTLIFKKIYNNRLYYYANLEKGDHLDFSELQYWTNIDDFRLATEEEQQQLLSMMKKNGKQWNAEKLRIENIPQRKFKPGDKVKLKDDVLDKNWENPYFVEDMHVFIGKKLTVRSCTSKGYLYLNEGNGWAFAEDWFEPYEELKKGDLAIFWDKVKRHAIITFYERLDEDETCLQHKDIAGSGWENAIKFESKEQFERLIKGKL